MELRGTKKKLQYTKKIMEEVKKDASETLSLVETEKATLAAKLEL